jgi:hypothetical protein
MSEVVVGEIHLFSKVRYGRTNKNVPLYKFVPLKPCTLPQTKVATTYGSTHGESTNVYAAVEYDSARGRATVLDIIGPVDDAEAGFRTIQYRHLGYTGRSRSNKRLRAVMSGCGAEGAVGSVASSSPSPRPAILCTIDPSGCRDVDDAVSFVPGRRQCIVGVHIADVSAHVPSGSALDRWFLEQPCSLYRPDGKVLHSLPEALSTGACSILADEPRHVISVRFTLTEEEEEEDAVKGGKSDTLKKRESVTLRVVDVQVQCETIVSRYQLTYEQADGLVRTDPTWTGFMEVVRKWQRTETADSNGTPIADAHELIAFLMIRTNEAIAKRLLQSQRGGVLLRTHAGGGTNTGASNGTARAMWTSMRAAYANSAVAVPHKALGLDAYVHFTSPIRRYADLHTHRLVKQYLLQDGAGGNERGNELADTLNRFMEAQSRVDAEWSWWWAVGCRRGGAMSCQQQTQTGRVLKWSVSDAFGVSVYVWLDAVGRGAWVRAVHADLMRLVRCSADADTLGLVKVQTDGGAGPTVTLKTLDAVQLRWWWDASRGVRGLRFQWVVPSLSAFLVG